MHKAETKGLLVIAEINFSDIRKSGDAVSDLPLASSAHRGKIIATTRNNNAAHDRVSTAERIRIIYRGRACSQFLSLRNVIVCL